MLFKLFAGLLLLALVAFGVNSCRFEKLKVTHDEVVAQNLVLGKMLKECEVESVRSKEIHTTAESGFKKKLTSDSTDFANRTVQLQSVVNALNVERRKLRVDNDYLRRNPVRLDLLRVRMNWTGKKARDSTFIEGYKWLKD